jgi:hypothetical protein
VFALTLGVCACRPANQNAPADREATSDPEVFYVRAAGGGTKDGSSWANALDGFPSLLERNAQYWVAAGQYRDYTFDDAPRGDSPIVVRKATPGAHGGDKGWKPEYARGQAVFGPLRFSTGRYTFDGGEPNGIRVVGRMGAAAVVRIDATHVVLRQVEIDGGFEKADGKQIAGACNGSNIKADHAVLDRCLVHNVADDGIGIYASHVKVLDSEIRDLDGCGTDGDCGPCYNGHSDGIELGGATDVEIVGNLVYDVRSNAALYMDDWSGSAVQKLVVRNNIFYTPDSGFAVYLQKVKGAEVHENVIWGKTQGSKYGGLSIGPGIEDLHMHGNVILNINFSHMGTKYDSQRHGLDGNRFGMVHGSEYTANPRDRIGDPGFAGIPMSSDAGAHRRSGLTRDDFEASRR